MRKRILFVMGVCLPLLTWGQYSPNFEIRSIQKSSEALPYHLPIEQAQTGNTASPQYHGSIRSGVSGTVLGTTTYDLQTNSATPGRIVQGPNGTLSVTWTGSTLLSGGWPDRGTFYVYFDGTSWSAAPSSAIESIRTGWPANMLLSDGNGGMKEFIVSHDPSASAYNLVFMNRASAGTGAWTSNSAPSFKGIWPRAAAGGANGATIHLINANACNGGCNNYTLYSRSLDGGTSWDIQQMKLPGIDTANCYNAMGGDAYAITARGNTVAVVTGNSNNTLRMWKSTDNGSTWTSKVVMTLPLCGFDGTSITDTMPVDGVADTLYTNDGAYDLVIDNQGMVHVWFGLTRILDTDPAAGWSFFPGTNGLLYWNESMGSDNLMTVGYCPDIDNDGTLAGIGADLPNYGVGLASMPAAAIDTATGNIYLVYVSPVENTDYFNDPSDPSAQSFRDLFGIYSTDGGATWSDPANLTNTAVDYKESVFPSVAKIADGKVHVVWQRDDEPGHSLENTNPDPVTINDIVYYAFNYSDFIPDTTTIGIGSIAAANINFYPNPNHGTFTADLSNLSSNDLQISIVNLEGQLIKTWKTASTLVTIDLHDQEAGLYLVVIKSDDHVLTNRVVVNH